MKRIFTSIVCTVSITSFNVFCADNQAKNALTWEKSFVLSDSFKQQPLSISYNLTGEKIITAIPGYVGIWDSKNGKKTASLIQPNGDHLPRYNKPTMVKYNEQEDKLFVLNRDGSRGCWNMHSQKNIWEQPAIPNMLGRALFNNDQTKCIMQCWKKAVVINALTGLIEKTLWENVQDNYSPIAEFQPNSSDILVMYNGILENMSKNEKIKYNPIVPEGNACSLYIPEKDTLVCLVNKDETVLMISDDYFNALSSKLADLLNTWVRESNVVEQKNAQDDAIQVKIINPQTKDEKSFHIRNRRDAVIIQSGVHNAGKNLLVTSWRDIQQGDFEKNNCFIDLFDLENIAEKPICTIECEKQPNDTLFVPAKNLLLLALDKNIQLWDISTKSLLWSNKGTLINSISMSPDYKQIAMVNDGNVEIWQEQK